MTIPAVNFTLPAPQRNRPPQAAAISVDGCRVRGGPIRAGRGHRAAVAIDPTDAPPGAGTHCVDAPASAVLGTSAHKRTEGGLGPRRNPALLSGFHLWRPASVPRPPKSPGRAVALLSCPQGVPPLVGLGREVYRRPREPTFSMTVDPLPGRADAGGRTTCVPTSGHR